MEQLLAWHNLIFTIPIAVGILFMLGIAFGMADVSHDIHHDVHHGHDDDGETNAIFSALGFGRCPMIIVVSTMCLLYGGTGFICNLVLGPLLNVTSLFVVGPIIVAFFVMFFGTGLIARTVAHWMPSTETYPTSLYESVGCAGTLVLPVDSRGGLVQFTHKGDVYQLQARSEEGDIAKGTRVIITDYDDLVGVCTVCRDTSND